ncbi:MAG TPA: TIGR01906 family membrane protein [Anaerolineaceae bacterium]
MTQTIRRLSIILILPLFLITNSIQLLINPIFLEVEYRAPGFPQDPYGFTLQDRLKWSKLCVNYLINTEGIDYLGDLRFDDGSVVFNDRELAHMVDVKNLVQKVIVAWYFMIIFVLLFGYLAWRYEWFGEYWLLLRRGAWITLGFVAFVLIALVISFYGLFTVFHQLFFSGDSWLFLYSDTLIRLFPLRFWQDAFILVGIFTIVQAVLILIFSRKFNMQKN